MWWDDVAGLEQSLEKDPRYAGGIAAGAYVENGVILDERSGPIAIGNGTRVFNGAVLRGPVIVGSNCLIGNQAMIRGPALIEDDVQIGFATEVKNALVGAGCLIGPMCFVADSRLDKQAYLGAQVRTSNQRLDRSSIVVRNENSEIDTGMDKLGCWIGARTSLGIQVIVLPGRVVPPDSVFEPRLTIARNFPPGRYRTRQSIESY